MTDSMPRSSKGEEENKKKTVELSDRRKSAQVTVQITDVEKDTSNQMPVMPMNRHKSSYVS